MKKDLMKEKFKKSIQAEKEKIEHQADVVFSRLGHEEKVPVRKQKPQKVNVIRIGFAMPEEDMVMFEDIKEKCERLKIRANSSELLRAGLKVLHGLSGTELIDSVNLLKKLQVGRPKNNSGNKKKPQKINVTRIGFAMPEEDMVMFEDIKEKCNKLKIRAQNWELLRAGLKALNNLSNTDLINTVDLVPKLQVGKKKRQQ